MPEPVDRLRKAQLISRLDSRPADPPTRRWSGWVLAGAMILAFSPHSARAQLSPPSTGGVVALDRLLQSLAEQRRVLMIAAHPDDEDTQLLSVLSLGYGARAAYLSLNRGEGGQNLIGPELGPQLGLIRSQELLAAREIDGATQFFTRTFDYGFSRTLEEAQRFWPSDSVLKDVVRIIRRFRPHVVVDIFSGTARDGHGQHQDAGWITPIAFAAAGDPSKFPELKREEGLDPWQPVKLYRSARFNPQAATVEIQTGVLDPRLGKSYAQVAMASRSRHRSQDMGQIQRIGPNRTGLQLIESTVNSGVVPGREATIFDGIPLEDPTLARLADSLRGVLSPARLGDVAKPLAELLGGSAGGRVAAPGPTTRRPADLATRQFAEQALAVASGLVIDAIATDDEVIPGQRFEIELSVYNSGTVAVTIDSLAISTPRGWQIEPLGTAPSSAPAGQLVSRKFAITVPDSAIPTQPYFLAKPLKGAMYDWTGAPASVRGLPFDPPLVNARAVVSVLGARVTLEREAALRENDQATGEIRRPVRIVPAIDVAITPGRVVWPAEGDSVRTFTVTLVNNGPVKREGALRLEVPGWKAPVPLRFSLERAGESHVYQLPLVRPRVIRDSTVQLRAVAETDDGRSYSEGVRLVDYPHIRPTPYVVKAEVQIRTASLKLAQVRSVGYIRGASDRVPEALASVGVPITLLSGDDIANTDLSRFDVLVVGSRAYEIDSSLMRHNDRVLDYAKRGGLVVVQYQQYAYIRGNYPALPLTIANPHDRVTDENAPVTVLDPNDRALVRPNPITPGDWDGWPQERGLYFAHTWDPSYKPLLEMHDPGMDPLRGSLLVTKYGEGTYVYTGLAFFRFLPAGIPGAFKLFMNLMSLNAKDAS
ncbi:MAG: PIG-L family deacetylase [Gemmatimonadetes bacterium]|nr:PIG-L family deacetylase [Gemmatimonadota bacterium]